jgi:hypothetical protein
MLEERFSIVLKMAELRLCSHEQFLMCPDSRAAAPKQSQKIFPPFFGFEFEPAGGVRFTEIVMISVEIAGLVLQQPLSRRPI